MGPFLLRRLLLMIPVVWIVLTLVFGLIHLVPGDPVAQMLGEGASVTEVERLRRELGLDRPVAAQYLAYLARVARLDLGVSLRNQEPVLASIAARYPATIALALGSLGFSLLVSVPLGVAAALRKGQGVDHAISIFTLLGVSLPNFVLGPLFILFFAIWLGWFPVSGSGSLAHLVLPAVTLGSAIAAISTRMVRSSILEEIHQDYVRTARAKGLSESRVVLKHAFRNGLIPILTIVGLQFGTLLGGAIVTEMIFSWPGLGRLMVDAIYARDYPLVQGAVLAVALTYILVNLATDVLYVVADPRIRYES
jgi:peptide/nickel transport system permease protein